MRRLCGIFGYLLCLSASGCAHGPNEMPKELLVSIDGQGAMYLEAEKTGNRLSEAKSREQIAAVLRKDPGIQVVIQADPGAPTAGIVRAIAWLNEHGAQFSGVPIASIP